jgi:uncharacterized membrane protein YfcA
MIVAVSGVDSWVPAAIGVTLLAAFVKGAIGFGFPTLATPLLALFIDPRAAVAALILPNIAMDGIQAARRGGLRATARRMLPVVIPGAAGTVLGTRLLTVLSARSATLVLGAVILFFVALSLARSFPRVPPRRERWLSPVVGFAAGVTGGVTNVPGTPLVIYFYALGMDKTEFVRSVGFTFVLYKLVQLGAVAWYGLLSGALLGVSIALSVAGLGAFFVGLRVQDRLDQRAFNRAVLVFLTALGLWLVIRSLA